MYISLSLKPLCFIVGAKSPVFSEPEAAKTNLTGLTLGSYVLVLEVKDNSGNTARDQTEITVTQDTNQAPQSDPGPNMKVVLPTNQVVLDGSGSSDDLAVETWLWTRDQDSLAGGTVVGNMTSSRLIISDLLPGTYSFSLQVRGRTPDCTVTLDIN